MVGSRNGFSKLVLAIMRGRGRVQAGSRTTLPTRLTTLNISHCITIKHSADTNTDNHTTLSLYVCSCSCQITISKFPCCSPSHLINSIFLGGQKLGKNGLNQAERWQNIHFSSCVWPAAAVICSAAGAGSWWWMLNEAVSAWCICCRIKWELDSAWYRWLPGPMLHKNWPRPILHWYSTRSWYHLAPPGVARNNSNYPASNDNWALKRTVEGNLL